MTLDERKFYLTQPYLNKNIFIDIVGIPKYAGKRLFADIRKKFVEELKSKNFDTSFYDNIKSNYLPTDYVLSKLPELKKYVRFKNGVVEQWNIFIER